MENAPGDLRSFFGATEFALLIAAIFVVFAFLGIAGLMTGRARSRAGGLAGAGVVLLAIAFLPFVVYFLFAVFLALKPGPNAWHDAYAVMHFVLIRLFYVFAGCAVLAAAVYFFSEGDHRERWSRSQAVQGILVAAALIYTALLLASPRLLQELR
ncbi:MAG TPA: hypothetical protein VFV88_11375 [Steroidobacteraceae bacterium]|jgi:hypothetical protein|nr:hypothetical protein [Steroidobacteraceae bacterium]